MEEAVHEREIDMLNLHTCVIIQVHVGPQTGRFHKATSPVSALVTRDKGQYLLLNINKGKGLFLKIDMGH